MWRLEWQEIQTKLLMGWGGEVWVLCTLSFLARKHCSYNLKELMRRDRECPSNEVGGLIMVLGAQQVAVVINKPSFFLPVICLATVTASGTRSAQGCLLA